MSDVIREIKNLKDIAGQVMPVEGDVWDHECLLWLAPLREVAKLTKVRMAMVMPIQLYTDMYLAAKELKMASAITGTGFDITWGRIVPDPSMGKGETAIVPLSRIGSK